MTEYDPTAIAEAADMLGDQDLVDRIEQLERRVADYATALDEAASMMANFTDTMASTEDVSRRAMLLDYVPASRLADAEQRAAAAWAAVTRLAERNEACVGVHNGAPSVIRYAHPVNRNSLMDYPVTTYDPVHCVTVVFAVNAPANPDLLERASVELAEAYQRAKAEERRHAEKAAATGTTATTASVDKIAREFCAQIVENVKR